MIFEELLYAFRNNLELEYLKRNVAEESKIRFNDKQLKLIYSKIVADLQKEFKIILSEQTISSLNGEQAYALTRDFMTLKEVYYESKKLDIVPLKELYDGTASSSTPTKCAIKQINSYPYLLLYPAPNADSESIYVKSYNDMTLYSINDGLDSKSNETDDTKYMKIPTMYDSAILIGMMSEIFDDRILLYEKEKLRLKGLRYNELSLDYNMTGIPETGSYNFNSDADATPTVVPGDPA